MGRFQFNPFWNLTQWGFLKEYLLRINMGCDEWHNESRFIIIPLVGEFVLFKKGYDTSGEVHLHAWSYDRGWEGREVPGCEICTEIMQDPPTFTTTEGR